MTWNSRINQFNVAHCQTLTLEAKKKKKQSVLLREKQVSSKREAGLVDIFAQ